MKVLYGLFIGVLFISGCSDSCSDAPDVSSFKKEVTIDRIDNALRNVQSFDDVKTLLKTDKAFADFILPPGVPVDEMAYRLYSLGTDTVFNNLYAQIDSVFGNTEELNADLSELFARVNYHFPKWNQPQVKAFVSGFGGYDLIQTRDMTLIGLDYFLGPKPKYFDQSFPAYILKYYTKDRISFKVSMAISNQFNMVDRKDQSVLAHMLFYGKAYYFTKQMFPCAADSMICEYSPEEINMLDKDPAYVWDHFIDKKLFFNTDREAIQKYIDDRPKVFEIGENCPGRIGRWLGYKIVESYMKEHPEVTLAMLMTDEDCKKIFNESHYRPGK